MYQETTRTTAYTNDAYAAEVFTWRNESTDPYTSEVQFIEEVTESEDWPEGIKVWWANIGQTQIEGMSLETFKAINIPKPRKRGGSPQGW